MSLWNIPLKARKPFHCCLLDYFLEIYRICKSSGCFWFHIFRIFVVIAVRFGHWISGEVFFEKFYVFWFLNCIQAPFDDEVVSMNIAHQNCCQVIFLNQFSFCFFFLCIVVKILLPSKSFFLWNWSKIFDKSNPLPSRITILITNIKTNTKRQIN